MKMITKKCKHCGKEITGYTENQVNYLLSQHLFSKHKDYYELTEKDVEELGYKEKEVDES